MAKSGAQTLTFKSVTDKQTNRQTDKKTQRFWPPWWRVKSEPTKLGMVVEDLEHVLVRLKLLAVRRTVSPLGGAENLGEPDTLKLNLP